MGRPAFDVVCKMRRGGCAFAQDFFDMNVLSPRFPEVILAATACFLFLLGISNRALLRKISAEIAFIALLVSFLIECHYTTARYTSVFDSGGAVFTQPFSEYIKLIATGIGMLLVLLNWPTKRDGSGGNASDFGGDTAEFFALMLLSLAGLCVVASANDLILLFLGIELSSIPTYVMVSISRPLPVAQEAGLKYFFLGAMSAAVMLFGFSYLYGTTGSTSLNEITGIMQNNPWTEWQIMAVILLLCGFAFKMAAVPLHAYAGDVYQGAATPVTAFLSFVPKTAGFVALIKVLFAVGGGNWSIPEPVGQTLLVLAGLTMTVGNVLALSQSNIKRTFAYSSVAHTGYMLVGITALAKACHLNASHSQIGNIQSDALAGVLFYLAAYGITNVAAFGVLQLLPSRHNRPATSAETFEDIAGQGRKHVALGLAMTVACLSLTGIPLTVGFLGKIYLTLPAGRANLVGLSITLWVNAAISAAYYLRIAVALFLRSEPTILNSSTSGPMRIPQPASVVFAVMASCILTLLLGTFFPATNLLAKRVESAARMEHSPVGTAGETAVSLSGDNSKNEIRMTNQ
jgi:NADH-quinone oxidoreductase subunit N